MLWHILWKNKNTFSLAFTLTFSLAGILWQKNPFSQGVGFLGKVTDRLSGALNASLQVPEILWVELDRYRDLEKKYSSALKQLEEYQLEKDRFDRLSDENSRLREQLGYQKASQYPEIPATVLGIRMNSISPRIIINRGTRDGITPFMPVVVRTHDQDGQLIRAAVGMIAQADSTTSIIQPIIHPSFQLGVRVEETGYWAILNGNSGQFDQVLLTYIAENGNPGLTTHSSTGVNLEPGQRIVTSGSGGLFPPGIPVGYILNRENHGEELKTTRARIFASLSRLDSVIILKKHPDKWAIQSERDISWDQHLMSEFGPTNFPEPAKPKNIPEPVKPAKPKPSLPEIKPEEAPDENPPAAGNTGSQQPETAPEESEQEEPVSPPRRINNVNVPTPGGN